jgi:hypothetical protein
MTADGAIHRHAGIPRLSQDDLPLLAPFPARTYTIAMGQQHRIRAKRKRRRAYLERRKAKRKAPPPKAPRGKVKKETAPAA